MINRVRERSNGAIEEKWTGLEKGMAMRYTTYVTM